MTLRILKLATMNVLGWLAIAAAGCGTPAPAPTEDLLTGQPAGPVPDGMVWIPGGTFLMGSADLKDEHFFDAHPVHEVSLRGFWMDKYDVTNAQFTEFVKATNYKTVAEKKPDRNEIMSKRPRDALPPPEELFQPGSYVFVMPKEAVDWRKVPMDAWWHWVPGACWNHPEGPASDLKGRENHPVVQICYEDAVAYCTWAKKRLPTEAEWEYAARGGLVQKPYDWGDEEPEAGGKCRCNIWQGIFPYKNTAQDGFLGTSPVGSFEPNGYGLYDMAGNVWQWCSDWYRDDYYGISPKHNPQGPNHGYDPQENFIEKRVQRGGSFLCSADFCSKFKPAGRGRADPLTSTSHFGFRCVLDAK